MTIVETVVTGVGVFISAVVAWFFRRKKDRVEIEGLELNNEQKRVDRYEKQIAGFIQREVEMEARLIAVEKEIKNLREELAKTKLERDDVIREFNFFKTINA